MEIMKAIGPFIQFMLSSCILRYVRDIFIYIYMYINMCI